MSSVKAVGFTSTKNVDIASGAGVTECSSDRDVAAHVAAYQSAFGEAEGRTKKSPRKRPATRRVQAVTSDRRSPRRQQPFVGSVSEPDRPVESGLLGRTCQRGGTKLVAARGNGGDVITSPLDDLLGRVVRFDGPHAIITQSDHQHMLSSGVALVFDRRAKAVP